MLNAIGQRTGPSARRPILSASTRGADAASRQQRITSPTRGRAGTLTSFYSLSSMRCPISSPRSSGRMMTEQQFPHVFEGEHEVINRSLWGAISYALALQQYASFLVSSCIPHSNMRTHRPRRSHDLGSTCSERKSRSLSLVSGTHSHSVVPTSLRYSQRAHGEKVSRLMYPRSPTRAAPRRHFRWP